MPFLVVVIFPYATTASAAAEYARQLDGDLAPDDASLAVVSCDDQGDFAVTTRYPGEADTGHAGFWFLLVNALVLLPSSGALTEIGGHALSSRLTRAGLDRRFQREMHDGLAPGTSALLLLLDQLPADQALEELRRFAGVVHAAHLTPDAEQIVADALVAANSEGRSAVSAALAHPESGGSPADT